MRIDLGGCNTAMAQHALYTADICTIHQEVSSKTVSHRVGTDMFGDSCKFCILTNHSLDTARSESSVASCRVCLTVAAVVEEQRAQAV